MSAPSSGRGTAAERRLRLAYFSPLPPARSGIADYSSRELLPFLAQNTSLTLFAEDPQAVAGDLRAKFPVHALQAYADRRWHFDAALYQLGNSEHHAALYDVMCRYPGIVVLHDTVLHHFMAHRTAGKGRTAAYSREIGYARGPAGISRLWAVRHGEEQQSLEELPLLERVLDLNLGLIVHSRHARRRVLAARPQQLVQVVPAPIVPSTAAAQGDRLPWPGDSLLLASFGQVTAGKRLDRALKAFSHLRRQRPQARYLVVGEALPEVDLDHLLRDLQLEDAVHVTGYVQDWQAFTGWLATADVVLNLRHPTLGETSATALRALAAGKPLVVYDHGWYAELPDDVAVKVPPLDDEALLAALQELAVDPARRRQLGERARAYAETVHNPRKVAGDYTKAIRRILAAITGEESLA